MKKKELVTILKALLIALAEAETPPPKPRAPVPPTPSSASWRFTGSTIEVCDAQGQWHAASFIPREYTRDHDGGGYWIPWYSPRR